LNDEEEDVEETENIDLSSSTTSAVHEEDIKKAVTKCHNQFKMKEYYDPGVFEEIVNMTNLDDLNRFLLDGKLVAYTKERSQTLFIQELQSGKLLKLVNYHKKSVVNYFLFVLFEAMLQRKWAKPEKPVIEHGSLDSTDYEVLVKVAGAAIHVRCKSKTLHPDAKKVLKSMCCKEDDPNVTSHANLVKEHNRGGLKFVKKATCHFISSLERTFQAICVSPNVDKNVFLKQCKQDHEQKFLDSIDPALASPTNEKAINLAFSAFLVYFFRCRIHAVAKILSEKTSAKKKNSLRVQLKKDAKALETAQKSKK